MGKWVHTWMNELKDSSGVRRYSVGLGSARENGRAVLEAFYKRGIPQKRSFTGGMNRT